MYNNKTIKKPCTTTKQSKKQHHPLAKLIQLSQFFPTKTHDPQLSPIVVDLSHANLKKPDNFVALVAENRNIRLIFHMTYSQRSLPTHCMISNSVKKEEVLTFC